MAFAMQLRQRRFQSTLPYGSDAKAAIIDCKRLISIHAPLRERQPDVIVYAGQQHFNPRSLTGAMRSATRPAQRSAFQSTLPYGSDAFGDPTSAKVGISIHAPLRERIKPADTEGLTFDFNPRSLTGATMTTLNGKNME